VKFDVRLPFAFPSLATNVALPVEVFSVSISANAAPTFSAQRVPPSNNSAYSLLLLFVPISVVAPVDVLMLYKELTLLD